MFGLSWMANLDNIWLTLLGEASLRAVMLLGAAWACCLLLRRRSAAMRHAIWASSLAALVVLPISVDFVPKVRIPAEWSAAAEPAAAGSAIPVGRAVVGPVCVDGLTAGSGAILRPEPDARRETVLQGEAGTQPATDVQRDAAMALPGGSCVVHRQTAAVSGVDRGSEAPAVVALAERTSTSRAADARGAVAAGASFSRALLLAAWAFGLFVFATRLIVGHVRLRRMARGARVVDVSDDLADSPAAGVRYLQSKGETMPMTWGWRKPVILLPASFGKWDKERRAMTIYHELAHVRRADWLTQTLAQAIRAVYWFHPLVWLALRRTRVEADRACDDMVLGQGIKASGYAGHLVRVAREFRTAGLRPWVAIAMAHPSSLDQRVRYVLDGTVRRAGLGRWGRLAVALSVGVAVLAVPSLDAVGQTAAAPQDTRATQSAVVPTANDGRADSVMAPAMPDVVSEDAAQYVDEISTELSSDPSLLAQAEGVAPTEQLSEDEFRRGMRVRQFELQLAQTEQKMDRARERVSEAVNESALAIGNKLAARRQPRLSPEAMQTASAALRKALSSSDANVRAQAAESLGQLGSTDEANLQALATAVSDGDPRVQRAATESLGVLLSRDPNMPSDRAVGFLKPALSSPDATIRRHAAEALRGLRGTDAINAAVQLVDDADRRVQREAIESLGELLSGADAPTAKSALPVLQKALQSEDPNVRRQIVESLGGLRSIADDVVPLLAKAAEDPDPRVQREAVEALGNISSGGGLFEKWRMDFAGGGADEFHWAKDGKAIRKMTKEEAP